MLVDWWYNSCIAYVCSNVYKKMANQKLKFNQIYKKHWNSYGIAKKLTRTKSGRESRGLVRSAGGRGSILRWPLWPVNPTRKESSSAAGTRSIFLYCTLPEQHIEFSIKLYTSRFQTLQERM